MASYTRGRVAETDANLTEVFVVPDVVKILTPCPVLADNWLQLIDHLGLDRIDFNSITANYRIGNIPYYEVLHGILTRWVAKKGKNSTPQMLVEALNKMDCVDVAGHVNEAFKNTLSEPFNLGTDSVTPVRTPLWHKIPADEGKFVGREDQLNKLHQEYRNHLEIDNHPSVIFVSGIGGIGKTSLAVQFCSIVRQHSLTGQPTPSCILLNAESRETLHDCCKELAHRLNVKEVQEHPVQFLLAIHKAHGPIPMILIVDNSNEKDNGVIELLEFLTQLARPYPFVIVNSRSSDIYPYLGVQIKVSDFSEIEAVSYISQYLPMDEVSSELISGLCSFVGRYPLGLKSLLCYIRNERSQDRACQLGQFIQTLKANVDNRLEIYKIQVKNIDNEYQYKCMYNIVTLTLETICANPTHKNAKVILCLLCCLRSPQVLEYDNLYNFFVAYCKDLNINNVEEEFENALFILKKYGICHYLEPLQGQDIQQIIKFHDVIADIATDYYNWGSLEEKIPHLEKTFRGCYDIPNKSITALAEIATAKGCLQQFQESLYFQNRISCKKILTFILVLVLLVLLYGLIFATLFFFDSKEVCRLRGYCLLYYYIPISCIWLFPSLILYFLAVAKNFKVSLMAKFINLSIMARVANIAILTLCVFDLICALLLGNELHFLVYVYAIFIPILNSSVSRCFYQWIVQLNLHE